MGLREWVTSLEPPERAVYAATFDTRIYAPHVPGSAAVGAMRALRGAGFQLTAESESFWVMATKGPLREGELDRARAWGVELSGLLSSIRPRSPGASTRRSGPSRVQTALLGDRAAQPAHLRRCGGSEAAARVPVQMKSSWENLLRGPVRKGAQLAGAWVTTTSCGPLTVGVTGNPVAPIGRRDRSVEPVGLHLLGLGGRRVPRGAGVTQTSGLHLGRLVGVVDVRRRRRAVG